MNKKYFLHAKNWAIFGQHKNVFFISKIGFFNRRQNFFLSKKLLEYKFICLSAPGHCNLDC